MPKVILITRTSTGFGRTAAETLARRGYRVFATMRDISGRNADTRQTLQSLAEQHRILITRRMASGSATPASAEESMTKNRSCRRSYSLLRCTAIFIYSVCATG